MLFRSHVTNCHTEANNLGDTDIVILFGTLLDSTSVGVKTLMENDEFLQTFSSPNRALLELLARIEFFLFIEV